MHPYISEINATLSLSNIGDNPYIINNRMNCYEKSVLVVVQTTTNHSAKLVQFTENLGQGNFLDHYHNLTHKGEMRL